MVAPSTQPTLFGRRGGAEEEVATAYVPFLLDKTGERAALEQAPAAVWDAMIPCIQILPPDARKEDERKLTPRQVIDRLRPAVARNLFYLDAAGVARASRGSPRLSAHAVEAVYRAAIVRGLGFIPVLPFERVDTSLLTVAMAREIGLGLGIRVRLTRESTSGGASLASRLASALERLRVRDLPIDLFVDLEYLDPNLEVGPADVARAIASIRSQHSFRTTTLLATSIPRSMSGVVDEGELRLLPRTEWALYLNSLPLGGADRFGDYGVQNCVPPDPGRVQRMVANIRFGEEQGLWVARDVGALDTLDYHEKGETYRRLAARMVALDGFIGRGCCQGDRDIEDIADGRLAVRSQTPLRRIATLHTLHVGTKMVVASKATKPLAARGTPSMAPALDAPQRVALNDQTRGMRR